MRHGVTIRDAAGACRMPCREPTRSRFAMAHERRVAVVDEPHLRLLDGASMSVYALAWRGPGLGRSTARSDQRRAPARSRCSYDEVYAGTSPWRLMTPIDHPEPAHCLVSGTGLTHLGSAAHRQAMHGKDDADLTDSMRMFRAGLEGGRPAGGDDRRGARVVLQRHGHGAASAGRGPGARRRTDMTAARRRNWPASTSSTMRGGRDASA